jgi:NAD(P)-dependent dehydrogenase (short-subunit alcohol dehydrogenase family)
LNPKETYLQLGFCIPGILFPEKSPAQIDAQNALLTYQTNALGPLLMIKHFEKFLPTKNTTLTRASDQLPKQAVWASMSARVGSITDNHLGGWFSYRSSKAALNQITKTFDNRLRTRSGEKALAISMHPGTVKTGLSKEFWNNVQEDKLFSPEFAAERLLEVVKGVDQESRGKCWDWAGKEVPP